MQQGQSVGGVFALMQVARRLGIEEALGTHQNGSSLAGDCVSTLSGLTAFRTSKTSHLEVRPVFVRTEASTRGHVLMVMLAYRLVREQKRAWKDFGLTVKEGLAELNRICVMELSVAGMDVVMRLPEPSPVTKQLLNALQVNLPPALPKSRVVADTKKKLPSRRKNV